MNRRPQLAEPAAWVGGLLASGLRDVTSDPACLDGAGRWVVVATFEGEFMCARFERWDRAPAAVLRGPWRGVPADSYTSSLDQAGYAAAVASLRSSIAAGDVYQANICRVLSAPIPVPNRADIAGLGCLLASEHPAPYAATVRLPSRSHRNLPAHGVHIACASPEVYLARDGDRVTSAPIKGTGREPGDLSDKDIAENIMIVDLVRNDLGIIARTGSVTVPALLTTETHPGLVHLVSTVEARLRPGVTWADILAATFPPGSVSGAPKSSALRAIRALEPVPRGPYCGAVGWVDADSKQAVLAVGIRTFWIGQHSGRPTLRFGTGAGITWGSDATREWDETELKAARLLAVAAQDWEYPP